MPNTSVLAFPPLVVATSSCVVRIHRYRREVLPRKSPGMQRNRAIQLLGGKPERLHRLNRSSEAFFQALADLQQNDFC